MKKFILYPVFLTSILSCSRPAEVKFTRESLADSIDAKETALKKLEVLTPDNSLAFEAVKFYKQFADSFPGEKSAPDYLFKAANVSIGIRQYIQAISFLERIKAHFPAYEKSPESLFLMAFIYDNYLDQKGRAREIYEEVIETYPQHKFASDAREVIKTLEMSDEELIKMFQEKEKEGTVAGTEKGK